MLCFNYDSYFRFVVFSRVLYLNKYVVFNYVSLLKSSFRLNIVFVVFVLNIVRILFVWFLSCVILFLSFILFSLYWAQPRPIQADPNQAQINIARMVQLLLSSAHVVLGPNSSRGMPTAQAFWPFTLHKARSSGPSSAWVLLSLQHTMHVCPEHTDPSSQIKIIMHGLLQDSIMYYKKKRKPLGSEAHQHVEAQL